ncbi:hypothetical protein UA08_06380 [Talaromyces atroroseus]|uniref:ABC transporter domain-containing protein n=1 Tax=Talaromyces atroroseus TaxID=1441469 RepID=A0A225ADQ6_TALAT|nr:hypothetical protein UA08_06380 [Talaromyces atroroseus]OKL58600.1 hypothetical protein UA08_06380 [Talaromyces atroroseus]
MAQAFTSLSLISLLTSPLLTFCQALPSIVQTLACFGRIQEYVFDKLTPSPDPELSMTTSAEGVSREAMELQEYDQSTASDLHLVSFNNADISWSPETQVVLNDLNLNIPEGITTLIGPVGSGKSTILESILGQTTLKRGSLNSKMTKVAYCGQTPWIIDGTIQQNITGGTEFENSWYRFVISACGLEADMKAIPKGDMCRTGSKGVSLSSGQKQRVSLARAVYSKNRVLVLDDVFSRLDSKTISVISSHLFSREGYIKTTGRSVILATHTHNIIVLDDGRIVDQGPYAEILSRRPDTIARSFMPVQNTPIASPVKECLTGEKADEFQVLISSDVDSIHSDATTQKRGAWSVYMYYYRSAGFVPVILLVFFSGIEAFGSNFATIWLQWWMEANEQQPNKELGKYLGVYAFLFGLSFLGVVAGCCQVRVVDIEAKAPLYAHFIETIQGLSTIHAFKWESRFRDQGQSYLNESQKPFYMLFCIHIWLQLVLNMIVGAITVIIVATMTSMRDRFAAGSIGVALNMVLTLNQSLAQMIRSWTMLETSIGAVSRVRDFVTGTPSELRSLTTPSRVEPEWPSHGAIEFAGVTVSYNPTSTPVLQNLSLKIRAGEKVAICGPSGSGKTSLILALLQLIDIQQGRIIVDDVDLSTVSRNTLRARLNTVPSDPFFMPGTLRFNLDPHRNATDESIESALKKVGLWKRISNEGGLDTELSASDWSIGERQLLTLARALNVRSSILILDEATSSVDWKTESIMQDVIDTEFASSQTIISILHRFRHIDRFDRVALLQGGKIVEYDSPQVLLARNSEFRKLYMSLQEH